MTTAVRTHEPPLARPIEFVQGVWHDLRRSGPLALEMANRDIRTQYRQALLGPAVVVLSPVALTAVALGFRRSGILHVDSTEVPYTLFVLVGVILWTTFVDAMQAPIVAFIAERRLLARTGAPAEAIALGKLGSVVLNLLIRLVLLSVAMVAYRIAVPATALLAPIGLLALVALGTAVGFLIAPINLLYRDMSWVLATATTLWFFFSPVYFPTPSAGVIATLMRINPVTPILSDTRSLILTGTIASPLRGLLVTAGSCLLLVICWLHARVVLCVVIEQVNE